MTAHDPLCRFQGTPSHGACDCPFIAKVAERERERIAQAMPTAFASRVVWDDGSHYIAVEDAARIARSGGGDD